MAPVEGPIFFEWLSEARARQLHGQWVTVRLRIDSLSREYRGFTLHDCLNRDDLHRAVWFLGQPEIDATRPLTVRGRLFVIPHKPSVINGTAFEGFTEIRLTEATPTHSR
jgi:hypothetical protein